MGQTVTGVRALGKLARSLPAVVSSVIALASLGCKITRPGDCDDGYARSLSDSFDVAVVCRNSVCSAHLSPAAAHRWSDLPPPEVAERPDTQLVEKCGDLTSRPDARFLSGSISDPCCSGGSSCTHFYPYVVSQSAAALCIAM